MPTTISTEAFFKHFGAMPIRFADTVYSTLPTPTIEEIFQHFKARLALEVSAPPEANPDLVQEFLSKANGEIQALQRRVYELEQRPVPKGKAGKPDSQPSPDASLKAGVELAAQDKHDVGAEIQVSDSVQPPASEPCTDEDEGVA